MTPATTVNHGNCTSENDKLSDILSKLVSKSLKTIEANLKSNICDQKLINSIEKSQGSTSLPIQRMFKKFH